MTTGSFKVISIEDLPSGIMFEGYYWYSNQKQPTCILDAPIQQNWFTPLPFIIEANFYSKTENLSIQVKNIDGEYRIAQINLNKTEGLTINHKEFIGHDTGNRNFKIIEAWHLQKDPLLHDMETMVPAWTAFAGFIEP